MSRLTTAWSGLAQGAIYVLTAVGYNMVFMTAGVLNLAQAQFVMVGTFIAFWTSSTLHLPVALGVAFGAVIGFLIGLIEERVAIRPVMGGGAHGELVTTVGVAVALDGIAEIIWGSQPQGVPFFVSRASLNVLGGRVTPAEIALLIAAVMVSLVLVGWTRYNWAGLASLAASEDREAAMLRGINVRRFSLLAVAAAAALAGGLGPFIGPVTYAVFNLGDALIVMAFVAISIGGFGSFGGAIIGGFLVGLVQAFTARYIGSNYSDPVVFALLLCMLTLRPRGLLRRGSLRSI